MKILKIFNIEAARNKLKENRLTLNKIRAMTEEIKNNPKFIQFFIDNLRYWIKIIDIQSLQDDIKQETLRSLLGEKRAYVRLLDLLTQEILVENKDLNERAN